MLVAREDWGFEGPLGPAEVRLPALEVWLHHSVTTPTDDPFADMHRLEEIGQDRFGRLSYSYAVHPSGVVLEGQGTWIGAHTQGRNSTSFGVCLIGNYDTAAPPKKMLDSTAWLLAMIGRTGLGPDQLSGGHRDTKQTACPGIHAYRAIPDINALARMRAVETPAPRPLLEDDMAVLARFDDDGPDYYWIDRDGITMRWCRTPDEVLVQHGHGFTEQSALDQADVLPASMRDRIVLLGPGPS